MVGFTADEKIRTIEEARKALSLIEEARKCGNSEKELRIKKIKGFKKKDMIKKAEKDATFFEHLYNEFIKNDNPAVKSAYDKLITEAMIITGQILQESDVAPRTVSFVIDNNVLTEDEMLSHYKRAFNIILEEKFNKPNTSSSLLYENVGDVQGSCVAKKVISPNVKGLIIKCVKNGSLDNNDPEAVVKYAAAEQAIRDAVSNVFIPQRILQQIQDYQNNLPSGYTDIFGNSIQTKIQLFNNIVSKIAAILAPFIFTNALENAGVKVSFDPASVAGITIDDNSDCDADSGVNSVDDADSDDIEIDIDNMDDSTN